MAAITNMMSNNPSESCLRPLNVRRDLKAVADLVELCFADSLDLDGRRYLQQMRSQAKNPGLLRLTSKWASAPLSGYVWEQDDKIVGNASLIPYYLSGKRRYLIANVAVHPDYRRRGIARQMTESIVEGVRARGAPSIWLHVRDDNQAAIDLYSSLNFIERTRRTAWINRRGDDQPDATIEARFMTPRAWHWASQRRWLREAYPAQYAWHLAIDLNLLRPGLFGMIWRLLNHARIAQWSLVRDRRLLGVLSWQAAHSSSDSLFLAAAPQAGDDDIRALLAHAVSRVPSQRPLSLDYPGGQYGDAMRAAGFTIRQTLIWMERPLA
jgi:ribosomal protein S18 acetylase RimI-like enzyme